MSILNLYCGSWNFKGELGGVKMLSLDTDAETVKEIGTFGEDLIGQSIITIAGNWVISICERNDGGKVVSYGRNEVGTLVQVDVLEVNSSKLSYVVAAPNGKYVFTSSMGNGTVRMIRVEDDGKLTLKDEFRLTGHSVTPRQNTAKTHSVMISPDGGLLAAANLGADEVELFRVDYEKERLQLLSTAIVDFGMEPRHIAFHPDGKYLYLLTESGNRLYVFRVHGESLHELAVYDTLDPNAKPVGKAADIIVSNDGRFIYSTNRGQNNIAVWKILKSGLLDIIGFFPCGGAGPRGLNLSPDGTVLLCANNDGGTVSAMKLNPATGIPEEAFAAAEVTGAGCVRSIERG